MPSPWLVAALAGLTLLAYAPAWHGALLWDDPGHVTPAALQSWSGLWRIWFEIGATQQYYPLVHSAFWVMHRLWGDHTLGYHLVNIVLHASSAWLFLHVLRRLAVPGALLAAGLFALHPVHVESVAWISELKNVLSGTCYLAAALVYLRYDVTRRAGTWAFAFGLFVLALLSKTVTASLPAALLVIFWWQRGRLDWRRDVLPLLPFFALGIAGGLTTAWVEHRFIGAAGEEFDLTPVERGLVAGRAIWFYLGKLLWPANLAFVYERWTVSQSVWWQYLYPLAAMGLVGAAWAWRRRSRAPLAALLFFIGTLVPALGFVDVYPFRYAFVADHFQYLASLGILTAVAAGLTTMARRRRWPAAGATAGAVALVAVLAGLTWRQSRQYVDAETLYETTIARSPTAWLAHNNLATLKLHRSRADTEAAIGHLREALRHGPAVYPEARYNLGLALEALGRLEEAVVEYRAVLAARPKAIDPRRNLAGALRQLGRVDEAIGEYRQALDVNPVPEIYNDLGMTLGLAGRLDDAAAAFEAAIRLKADYADAHNNLGSTWLRLGRYDAALSAQQTAVRLNPASADAHYNLGTTLTRLGRLDDAIAAFREAARLDPADASALHQAGRLLLERGRYADAVGHLEAALRLRPGDAALAADLARARAGGRRPGGG